MTGSVRGDHWRDVRSCVTLHHSLPMPRGVPRRIRWLTADRRRIEQDLRTHERHRACGLGEPLVPTNSHADLAVCGVPHSESGVTWAEVELLGVARPIRNVALAIDAHHRAVSIQHCNRVEQRIVGTFEHADRKNYSEFSCNVLEVSHCWMPVDWQRASVL